MLVGRMRTRVCFLFRKRSICRGSRSGERTVLLIPRFLLARDKITLCTYQTTLYRCSCTTASNATTLLVFVLITRGMWRLFFPYRFELRIRTLLLDRIEFQTRRTLTRNRSRAPANRAPWTSAFPRIKLCEIGSPPIVGRFLSLAFDRRSNTHQKRNRREINRNW